MNGTPVPRAGVEYRFASCTLRDAHHNHLQGGRATGTTIGTNMTDPINQHENEPSPRTGGLRRAAVLLLPVGRDAELTRPGGAGVAWLVPLGLGVGIVYAAGFAGTWRVYGEYMGLRLLPAAVVFVLDLAVLGRRLWAGLYETAGDVGAGDRGTGGAGSGAAASRPTFVALAVLIAALVLKLALLLALPRGQAWTPGDWRRHLMPLYPQPVLRPLILMALWGRWSVLLALSLGRARAADRGALSQLISATGITTILAWVVPCVGLTVVYTIADQNIATGLLISCVMLAVSYAVAVGLSWRLGGQSVGSVRAAGAVGEIVFLLAYLPFGSRIHGW
jgi:hypothetical protein